MFGPEVAGSIGWLWLRSGTARSRPEESVGGGVVADGRQHFLEGGEFVCGDVSCLDVACFVYAVVETISPNEPAGAHFARPVPIDTICYHFVGETGCPVFAGLHFAAVGRGVVFDGFSFGVGLF